MNLGFQISIKGAKITAMEIRRPVVEGKKPGIAHRLFVRSLYILDRDYRTINEQPDGSTRYAEKLDEINREKGSLVAQALVYQADHPHYPFLTATVKVAHGEILHEFSRNFTSVELASTDIGTDPKKTMVRLSNIRHGDRITNSLEASKLIVRKRVTDADPQLYFDRSLEEINSITKKIKELENENNAEQDPRIIDYKNLKNKLILDRLLLFRSPNIPSDLRIKVTPFFKKDTYDPRKSILQFIRFSYGLNGFNIPIPETDKERHELFERIVVFDNYQGIKISEPTDSDPADDTTVFQAKP